MIRLPTIRGLAVAGALTMAALLCAGCDKCGHPISIKAPSLPNACGANADPSR